jgi:hypothetical protein
MCSFFLCAKNIELRIGILWYSLSLFFLLSEVNMKRDKQLRLVKQFYCSIYLSMNSITRYLLYANKKETSE